MNNSFILLFWAIAVFIICASGTAFVYKEYQKKKREIQAKIDLADKELLQDFDDVKLTELMQTKAGNELLTLLVKENPDFNLLASQKTLSEILTRAKAKKTVESRFLQFNNYSIPSLQQEESLMEQRKAKIKLSDAQMEQRLNEQLSEIQARKIELTHRMNKAQIELLEQKISMLGSAFEIVSKEYTSKLSQDFPKQLEQLKENARTLPPKELFKQMDSLISRMNPLLDGMPENLGELKIQLLKAANDLEQQTNLLVASDEKAEKEESSKE